VCTGVLNRELSDAVACASCATVPCVQRASSVTDSVVQHLVVRIRLVTHVTSIHYQAHRPHALTAYSNVRHVLTALVHTASQPLSSSSGSSYTLNNTLTSGLRSLKGAKAALAAMLWSPFALKTS
jgi:hypothetical protein